MKPDGRIDAVVGEVAADGVALPEPAMMVEIAKAIRDGRVVVQRWTHAASGRPLGEIAVLTFEDARQWSLGAVPGTAATSDDHIRESRHFAVYRR